MSPLRAMLFLSHALLACSAQGQDLRVVWTNLVDFDVKSPPARYTIEGVVTLASTGFVRFEYKSERIVLDPEALLSGGPEAQLSSLAALRMSAHMTPGQLFSLSPQMRDNFRVRKEVKSGIVFNFPYTVSRGDQIQAIAMPVAPGEWDYGKPINPQDALKFKSIFRISRSGLIEQRFSPDLAIAADPDAQRRIRATNGIARAQCELGMHYLMGLGVDTNKDLAVFWIKRAADQGFPEAVQFLSKTAAASR